LEEKFLQRERAPLLAEAMALEMGLLWFWLERYRERRFEKELSLVLARIFFDPEGFEKDMLQSWVFAEMSTLFG
jgi:hypothetical protein